MLKLIIIFMLAIGTAVSIAPDPVSSIAFYKEYTLLMFLLLLVSYV